MSQAMFYMKRIGLAVAGCCVILGLPILGAVYDEYNRVSSLTTVLAGCVVVGVLAGWHSAQSEWNRR